MSHRTSEQWQALFALHKTSGLIQADFAKQDGNDGSVELTPKSMLFANRWCSKT